MDVLDDLEGEAKEVCGPNPWLNYALPLHRAREWGLHKRVFDLLDEKGSGTVGRWELLRGMMDTPEVRGLLHLSTVPNQAEFDALTKAMGGEQQESDKPRHTT